MLTRAPRTVHDPQTGVRRRAHRTSVVTTLGWLAAAAVAAFVLTDPAPPAAPVSSTPASAHPTARQAPVRVVSRARSERVVSRATPPRAKRSRPLDLLRPQRVASASPLLMPRLALPTVLVPRLSALRDVFHRPAPGELVAVRLSAYCLRGHTRRGLPTRAGIVAADPRVFSLARYVELYAGAKYLGRYLVDDTGRDIKGARIDIWTPDCRDAREFGVRDGAAALVPAAD